MRTLPRSIHRSLIPLGLGLVVVVAGLARDPRAAAQGSESLRQLEAVETVRLRLPRPGVRGLHWRQNRLWLLYGASSGLSAPDSSFQASILTLDPESENAEVLRTERDSYEVGLVMDHEFLWSTGSLLGESAQLFRLDPRTGGILDAFPLPGQHPGGLAFDGSYLWVADADARKLFRMDVEEGKVSRKIRTPGFYPTGLTFDGSYFWCADAASGRIYRMRGNNGRVDAVLSRDAFYRPGSFVSLDWDGQALWWAAADDSFAVRLELLR